MFAKCNKIFTLENAGKKYHVKWDLSKPGLKLNFEYKFLTFNANLRTKWAGDGQIPKISSFFEKYVKLKTYSVKWFQSNNCSILQSLLRRA